MKTTTNLQKKKLIENFQFDPKDVKLIEGYQIINAKNILLNEIFTLKRIRLDDQKNQHKNQQILKEISILKELSGINIIKCHKILKSKSHMSLVYDYFSGKNLANLIQKNDQVLSACKNIDKLIALKLHEDYIDFLVSKEYMIGKQLCQALKQIQSKNIVHMRLWPQNILIGKNNFIKIANFAHYHCLKNYSQGKCDQEIESNPYVDPFLIQTRNFGFYTDIFSFGKILEKLYDIFRCSQVFKQCKQFQQLIAKMIQTNSYRRPDLEEIYNFFFGNQKQNNSRNRKSRDSVIPKSTNVKYSKTRSPSISPNGKQIRRRSPSISSTTSQKQTPTSVSKVIKSQNQLRNFPSRNSMRTVEVPESMSRSRQSSSLYRPHSQTNIMKRSEHSPNPTQISSAKSLVQDTLTDSFRIIIQIVIKKRNLSILLLKLGDVIASKIIGQTVYSLQLAFLLYKKSLIEIVGLAKYLSKGSKKYMPQISETMRLKFSKTQEYFLLTKVVNQQLEQQRNILVSISSLIRKECPSILKMNSHGQLLNDLKQRQTYIPELPQFEKEIKYEAFSNEFFMKTIIKYLKIFKQDILEMNTTSQNAHEILFYVNLLWKIYECGSYQKFVQEFFQNQLIGDMTKRQERTGNFTTYKSLLQMNSEITILNKMSIKELSQELISNIDVNGI